MNNGIDTAITISDEFKAKLELFNKSYHARLNEIAREKTPQYDGTGKQIVRKKGDTGYDYIQETYMRDCLDRHFPGWSWEPFGKGIDVLGSEWVGAMGVLTIVDPYLIPLGINPPVRKFFGVDYVRIQYNKNQPHTPEYLVDIGDNAKSANTAALKYAINRLTRIGDDVYGKRIEYEGSGSLDDIIAGSVETSTSRQSRAFGEWLAKKHVPVGEALRILKIKSLSDITNYKTAQEAIIKEKEL